MQISIAMATYNGAKYLQEQLDSFLAQTRLPDEIIICDDVSTDETANILLNFMHSAPFKVEIVRNECNLGYTKNFEKAISLCTGDIIFLSDQDDVWFSHKLKTIEDIFLLNSEILVVLNDQEITDEFLNPSGNTIFSNSYSLGFDASWLSAGCCTAFRLEYKNISLPFPVDLIAHDGWIHRLAAGLDVRKVVPDVLQYYRRHSSATSESMASSTKKTNRLISIFRYGLRDVTFGWRNEILISEYLIFLISNRFEDFERLNIYAKAILLKSRENNRVKALEERIMLLKLGRLKRFFGVLIFYKNGGYDLFSGWRSVVKDLIR